MRRRLHLRWWPLFLVALVAACEDDKMPPGGGTPTQDSGTTADTATPTPDTGGTPTDDGGTVDTTTPPTGDGGVAPCNLDLPTELDRPPSGRLPCDLLPPGFVAP